MLPLAESTPSSESLKDFLLVVGFLVGIGLGVKNLFFKSASTVPDPLTVKEQERYATTTQLKEVHGRIARERAEINEALAKIEASHAAALARLDAELIAVRDQLAQNNADGEARATKLHDRINAMLESTSELRGIVLQSLAAKPARH